MNNPGYQFSSSYDGNWTNVECNLTFWASCIEIYLVSTKIEINFASYEKNNFMQIQEKYHFWGMPLLSLGQFVMHLAMLERLATDYMSGAIRNI